jgi:hypothetical protein
MGEKGATLGMPIDQFTNEAFEGLEAGKDTVVVGYIPPREVFFDILEKRRKTFEGLTDATRPHMGA